MFNLFDAAKTVLNSVSSTNLFPWNFIDPNHGPFQLPAQMTRKIEYRPLERKRKINQIETNLTKKLKPTPIIEEVLPPSLPLVSQVVSPKSPQISSCTCSHTPPASPLQSPLKAPLKTPIELPIESPIQSPEKLHQPEIIIEEVVLSSSPSSPSTPTSHTSGLKSTSPSPSPSPCTRSQSPPATPVQPLLQSPEKPHEPTIIIEEVDLSSSPSTPTSHTMGLKSPSTSPCNRSQSPPSTPVQPALQSPEKPHEPTIIIEEVDLSSPSSCSSSRLPMQSPEKTPQPTTPVKEDFVSSQSNTAPQTMEIKKLSPSKLSILSLQNLEFFSSNSELLNKLTNDNFDYNQFKDTLKNPFDTIMFYLLVQAKASLDSASAINLFPWNFDVFHISIYPREPHQVFSSIHGNLPVPYKTVCDDFQRKVSIVVIENRRRFICKNDLCNHGNKKFSKEEKVISHLYKKYVLFVCVACGAMFHQRSTLDVHQTSHCRFRKKLKAPDNDSKNEDDKVIEDENDSDGEKNVDMKTEEEDFKILIQTALKRAHEDGLLIQFEEIEALINALSNDLKSMSFLVLLARIIMCQEEKYGLERDELHCHDDYYKIWMDTERCFQIVELATKKAVSIKTLETRVQQGVSRGWRDFVCGYPFCRCSGGFRRKTKLEVVSHIEQSNYRLVCCGCHSSFKVISSLIRHSNDSCKHSKLLDEMKETTKK